MALVRTTQSSREVQGGHDEAISDAVTTDAVREVCKRMPSTSELYL